VIVWLAEWIILALLWLVLVAKLEWSEIWIGLATSALAYLERRDGIDLKKAAIAIELAGILPDCCFGLTGTRAKAPRLRTCRSVMPSS
jgi:hypothetical protein